MKPTLICARSVKGSGEVEGPAVLVTPVRPPGAGVTITMVPTGSKIVGLVRQPGETEGELLARAKGGVA